jgi:hypothetical protein
MKNKLLLGLVLSCISVVAIAQSARPKFNAAAIDVAESPNARISSLYQKLLATTHPQTFIAPDGLFGCTGEADCEAKGVVYYQRIGALSATGVPTASRGTMEAWLLTHGFSLNPLVPKSDEIRAVYFNRADLGFGRDLHCRSYRPSLENAVELGPNTSPLRTKTGAISQPVASAAMRPALRATGTWSACYVTNFGDNAAPLAPNGNEQQAITKAKTNSNPIATVAMEIYRPDSASAISEVRFFVFDTGGNFSGGPIPLPTALKGPLLPFAILDNDHSADPDGKKASPGTCLNCHGGTASFSTASPKHPLPDTVVTGANFLPFDAQLFGYDTTAGSAFTEFAQRQTMRKLNALVKGTQPAAPTISSLIDGWYAWCGGVSTAGCAIDDAGHPFTPAGWAAPSAAQLASLGSLNAPNGTKLVNLYQNVSRKYCRTCHLANADYFDVQDVNKAHKLKGKLNPNAAISSMPNAERTFNDYWADAIAKGAYATLWGLGSSVPMDSQISKN